MERQVKFRTFGFWNIDNFRIKNYNNVMDVDFDLDCIALCTADPLKAAEEALRKLVVAP